MAGLLLALTPRPARADDQTLLLDVTVNGYAIGTIGEFTLRGETLLARSGELTKLGFHVPPMLAKNTDDLVGLSQLPGLTWRLDLPRQAIFFTAAENERVPVRLGPDTDTAGDIKVQSGAGLTLNYDVSGVTVGSTHVASGLVDMRGFSPWGVVNSGFLMRAGTGVSPSLVRLDSTAQYSDVASLRRYTVGDFISDGLSWTRPVRMAGLQIQSDFSLRPDLVTFPLPTVSGAAAVPSTVDVFANGVRMLSQHVEPGPFEIPNIPVVNGAGVVSMTLTNLLGNQITTSMPFYASSTLLAPGLQTYSVQSGYVRRYFGLLSDSYAPGASSAFYRRGLTQELTVEASAETTLGMYMGGGGVVLNVFDWAVVNAAGAVSQSRNGTGTQISLGIQHLGLDFSYSGTAIVADSQFRDVAGLNGDFVPLLQLTGTLGFSLGPWGDLGIAYARIDRPAGSFSISIPPPATRGLLVNEDVNFLEPVLKARLLSASYSLQLRDMSLSATGYHNFTESGSSGIMFSLTMPLGERSSASASLGQSSSGQSGQVQAQQSASSIGDWGYQAYASGGSGTHEFAQGQYKSPYALFTAGIDHGAGQTALQLQSQGAFSLVEGTAFGSNSIPDSFALVKTGGLSNVHVLQENRDAGTTNYRGMLVVPDLRSFEINHLAIDPDDIPADTTIDTTTREIRPQDRSGVVVEFAVKISHGALLQLVDETGGPVPVGSTATLLATEVVVPVGYDGNAYIEGLAPHNVVRVERLDGQRCTVAFDYVAARGEIPKIGPLHCLKGLP